MKILIVEDEKALATEVEAFLKKAYLCDIAGSAVEALEKCDVNTYDFILLDIGLPDKDGYYLLKEIRKDHQDVAIIMLTARGNVEDRIKGLDLGADDYLPKPFSMLELQSRMQAIIRRKYKVDNTKTQINDFVIDAKYRQVFYKEKEIELSRKEFDLLNYLLLHKNRPLTRMQLSDHLWGDNADENSDSNYIDVHIKNIRKKLSNFGAVDWIETVRGVGYKIKKQD